MADLLSIDEEFFSEESYQEYVKQQNERHNEKYRGDDENFFDALLSEEADFTKAPYGQEIISAIRGYK